jgi:hypothetical protein
MNLTRTPIRVLAAAVVALGALCGPAAAAATPASAAVTTHTTYTGLHVAGFDAAVAKAHGYKIVTYANGDRQAVPADPKSKLRRSPLLPAAQTKQALTSASQLATVTARAAAQRPISTLANTDYNEVWGNCGRSWIRVAQTSTHQVAIISGFSNTPEIAYYWDWYISLTDQNGTSQQHYDHSIYNTQASRLWQNLNQYGWTYDYVSAGGAVLVDGTICLSGRPDVYISL